VYAAQSIHWRPGASEGSARVPPFSDSHWALMAARLGWWLGPRPRQLACCTRPTYLGDHSIRPSSRVAKLPTSKPARCGADYQVTAGGVAQQTLPAGRSALAACRNHTCCSAQPPNRRRPEIREAASGVANSALFAFLGFLSMSVFLQKTPAKEPRASLRDLTRLDSPKETKNTEGLAWLFEPGDPTAADGRRTPHPSRLGKPQPLRRSAWSAATCLPRAALRLPLGWPVAAPLRLLRPPSSVLGLRASRLQAPCPMLDAPRLLVPSRLNAVNLN